VRRPLKTPYTNINANYNPVAEAEAILAEDVLNVPTMMGAASLDQFSGSLVEV